MLALLHGAHGADVLEPVLRIGEVGEEQLEHSLVANLPLDGAVAGQPLLERVFPCRRQLVDRAGPSARRLIAASDQLLRLEPAQLRIDLSVARGPEVPRRAVDELLDVVPGLLAERDHPEDHAPGGGEGGAGASGDGASGDGAALAQPYLVGRLHRSPGYIAP